MQQSSAVLLSSSIISCLNISLSLLLMLVVILFGNGVFLSSGWLLSFLLVERYCHILFSLSLHGVSEVSLLVLMFCFFLLAYDVVLASDFSPHILTVKLLFVFSAEMLFSLCHFCRAQLSPSPSCAELQPYSQLFSSTHPATKPPDRESLAQPGQVLV